MKSQDFERLKAVCEKEGFEIERPWNDHIIVAKKKDIWEGVEFAEFIEPNSCHQFTNGNIYKVDHVLGNRLNVCSDNLGYSNGWQKTYFKPSTESAYIEQLKAESFKRFGEIKEGDRFNRNFKGTFYDNEFSIGDRNYIKNGFEYFKESDALMFYGHSIYREGKWATRVTERVKVEWARTSCDTITFNYGNSKDVDMVKEGPKLSKLIEQYLNKEE